MNMQLDWIPRLDGSGNGMAAALDEERLGKATISVVGRREVHRFDSIGQQVYSTVPTVRKMARLYAKNWQDVAGYGKLQVASAAEHEKYGFRADAQIPQVVFDAATDFVTSGLKKFLGPAEDIERGMEDPFYFVARPGSPALIPSRRTMDPGHRSIAIKVREPTGQAQFVNPANTRGLQRAAYFVEEKEMRAHWYGIQWGLNVPETWEATILGEDPLGQRQRAATYALDLFQENVSGWGDTDRKIQGAYTVDGALRVLGGQQFSSGGVTAEQMIQRVMVWEAAYKRANGGRKPSGVIAADSERQAMQTRLFPNTAVSAWNRMVGTGGQDALFPWMNNATWVEALNLGTPAGDAARWVLYGINGNETFIEATPTMLFGPFEDRMETTWIGLRRIGGVFAKLPERFEYVDMAA